VTGNGTELQPWISDVYYADNAGSLSLDVYQEAVLNLLTVADNGSSGNSATAMSTDTELTDISQNSGGTASIHISGLTSPNTSAAYGKVFYEFDKADGTLFSYGNLPEAGLDETLSGTAGVNNKWTVKAGVDTNGNGLLDTGEVTRSIELSSKAHPGTFSKNDGSNTAITSITLSKSGAGGLPTALSIKLHVQDSAGKTFGTATNPAGIASIANATNQFDQSSNITFDVNSVAVGITRIEITVGDDTYELIVRVKP